MNRIDYCPERTSWRGLSRLLSRLWSTPSPESWMRPRGSGAQRLVNNREMIWINDPVILSPLGSHGWWVAVGLFLDQCFWTVAWLLTGDGSVLISHSLNSSSDSSISTWAWNLCVCFNYFFVFSCSYWIRRTITSTDAALEIYGIRLHRSTWVQYRLKLKVANPCKWLPKGRPLT